MARKKPKKPISKKAAKKALKKPLAKKNVKKKVTTKKPVKKKAPTERKTSTKKSKTFSFWRFMFKWLFVLSLWSGIFLTILFAWYATELPGITKNAAFERKPSIIIQASDGSRIVRYGEVKGNSVSVKELPPHLIYAVLATEDRRFYQHPGMDPLGLARAMWINIKTGQFRQGGSTITQQLAKNLFLTQDRTIKRKIQEAMLAFWLENQLSKDEILSAYLNRVYLGAGLYGVDAAAKRYFSKDVREINLREAATLAGLLKAPSRYSPLKNPSLSRKRTDVVLRAMVSSGYITQSDLTHAHKTTPPLPVKKHSGGNSSRYFSDWVMDGLKDIIGTPAQDIIVETTLDPTIQKTAQKALTRTLRERGEARGISQGAIIVMRPDGAILSMIGGQNYLASQFNRAVQSRRPPGSAFKPILFLNALEQGWSPRDKILDAPFEEDEPYRPKNFAEKYFGEVTLNEALTRSMNTAAVRLMQETGRKTVIDTAKRLGIFSPLEPDLSLALGSSGISLLEMSTAYSVMANGGMSVFPYAIKRITSTDGTLYYERPETISARRVIKSRPLKTLTGILQNVIEEGTGRRARLDNIRAAGKTGTSQGSRDAWFIGFTDELVTGVWLGNDDNTPMNGVTGGAEPAAIWKEIMQKSSGKYDKLKTSTSGSFSNLLGRLTGGFSAPPQYADPESEYNE